MSKLGSKSVIENCHHDVALLSQPLIVPSWIFHQSSLLTRTQVISNRSSFDGSLNSVVWKLQLKYLCYRLTLLCPVQDTLLVPSISSRIWKRNTMAKWYLIPLIRSLTKVPSQLMMTGRIFMVMLRKLFPPTMLQCLMVRRL